MTKLAELPFHLIFLALKPENPFMHAHPYTSRKVSKTCIFAYYKFCVRWTDRWLCYLYFKWHFKNGVQNRQIKEIWKQNPNCLDLLADTQDIHVYDCNVQIHMVIWKLKTVLTVSAWSLKVMSVDLKLNERKLDLKSGNFLSPATKRRQQELQHLLGKNQNCFPRTVIKPLISDSI